VTQKVNLEGYHGGDFRKSATMETNASNIPSMSLVIKGRVKPIIDVSTSMIRLFSGRNLAQNDSVVLKTTMPDFKIDEVLFKPFETGATAEAGSPWQTNLPLYATFELKRTTQKPDSLGDYIYSLRLSLSVKETKTLQGDFNIKTNHPDKQQLSIRGMIEAKK